MKRVFPKQEGLGFGSLWTTPTTQDTRRRRWREHNWELPFILHCDASDAGVGGYLAQMEPEGTERAIRFFHKAFSGSMVNWSTFSKEAYAVIYALEQCASYLAGRHFKVVTDHKPLIWVYRAARKLQGPSRVYSWAVLLNSFNFEIEHIPSMRNVVTDALSRPPFLPPAEVWGRGPQQRQNHCTSA